MFNKSTLVSAGIKSCFKIIYCRDLHSEHKVNEQRHSKPGFIQLKLYPEWKLSTFIFYHKKQKKNKEKEEEETATCY